MKLTEALKIKEMGTNARKTVIDRYSWEKISEMYHSLYKNLT